MQVTQLLENFTENGSKVMLEVNTLKYQTNLVLSLVNLVTNLAKPSLGQPSHKSDQT